MPKEIKIELSTEQVLNSLAPFGVHATSAQICMIREYVQILLNWNKSVGLTTIVNPTDIVGRHFGESMFAGSVIPVENCRLADVGSGAGFPGLALKIFHIGLNLTLIESNNKKAAFLSEVVRSLALSNVEILPMRFEDVRVQPGFVDIVTARAVGGFPEIMNWSRKALYPRGNILLWIGGEDIAKISSTTGWTWQPAVRIPESKRRFILSGRPLIEISAEN